MSAGCTSDFALPSNDLDVFIFLKTNSETHHTTANIKWWARTGVVSALNGIERAALILVWQYIENGLHIGGQS